MSATNLFERQIIRHFLRNTAQTPAAALSCALLTDVADEEAGSVTEVSGGSYARQAISFDDDTGGVTQNSAQLNFPVATAGWGTVTHVGIYDASTAGNLLLVLALAASKTVASGEQLTFAAGAISPTLN